MRAFVAIGLGWLAAACGADSQALFDSGGSSGLSAGGHVAASVGGSGTEPPNDGGEPSVCGTDAAGSSATEPTATGGRTSGAGAGGSHAGLGGAPASGAAGKASVAGSGGSVGGTSSSGGVAGGNGAAGSGGSPPKIPLQCAATGACTDAGPVAHKGYCEVSDVWPEGACVQCPNHYLDCDGPAPEVYGTPGAGCETLDTNQGSCPK